MTSSYLTVHTFWAILCRPNVHIMSVLYKGLAVDGEDNVGMAIGRHEALCVIREHSSCCYPVQKVL